MVSGIDLLKGRKTVADKEPSGLGLLRPEKEIVPSTEIPEEISKKVEDISKSLRTEAVGEVVEKSPVALPSVGLGAVLDTSKEEFDRYKMAPIVSDEDKEAFVETVGDLAKLAGQPYDVAKGAAEFAIHGIPTFLMGLGFAFENTMKKGLPKFLAGGTVMDMYEAATEGFEKAAEIAEPARKQLEESLEAPRKGLRALVGDELTKYILGLPEDVRPELVGEVGMVPATGIAAIGHKIADKFEGHENVQGILRFATDAVALASLGKAYHGGSRKAVADIKAIETKARDIARKERAINQIPDEAIKQAQKKIIETQKRQLDLEAKQMMEKLDYGKMIKEDLAAKSREIERVKNLPRKRLLDEQIHEAFRYERPEGPIEATFTSKRGKKYEKVQGHWYDSEGKLVESKPILRAAEEKGKAVEIKKEVTERPKIEQAGRDRYKEFIENLGFKIRSEAKGQEFLDRMEEAGISPVDANRRFWDSTYDKLSESQKETIHKYVEKLTGMKPGDVISVDPKTGKKEVAESWRDLAENIIDLGDSTEHLEGTTRGYVSLIQAANERLGEERVTDLDLQTNTRTPYELEPERSPFREHDAEVTKAMEKVYKERSKAVANDPELFTGKLLNDANRWLDGDTSVPIDKVRDSLSELAARAEELRDYFRESSEYPSNFNNWKELVSEAAIWARRADRSKIKQTASDIPPKSEFTLESGGMQQLFEAAKKGARKLGKLKKGVTGSVSLRESELLKDITRIHTNGKIDVDMTYSKGAMWRGTGIEPKYKLDRRIEKEGVIKADTAEGIPLRDNSVSSIMFDPPFIAGPPSKMKYAMTERFTGYKNINELWDYMDKSINEAYRVLKPGGKLIVKIQDVAVDVGKSTRQNYFSSAEVYNFGVNAGFRPVDRFINVKAEPRIPPNMTGMTQKMARKMHSDYWVFEKPKKAYKHPDRSILKRTEPPSVDLNIMVPVDQIPKVVSDMIRGSKELAKKIRGGRIKASDLYRNEEVFRKTGFWLGRDGKWRYEINDRGIKFKDKSKWTWGDRFGIYSKPNTYLPDVIEYPELFKAIPEVANVKVAVGPHLSLGSSSGRYNPVTNTIELRWDTFETIILHEIQHAVNRITGSKFLGTHPEAQKLIGETRILLDRLRKISNVVKSRERKDDILRTIDKVEKAIKTGQAVPNAGEWLNKTLARSLKLSGEKEAAEIADFPIRVDPYKRYKADPGEMEARLAERRMYMSAEQRRKTPPWETLDDMLDMEGLRGKGTELYDIGGAVAKGAKELIKGADDFAQYLKESKGYKKFKPKEALRIFREEFNRSFVDRSGNIRREILDKLSDDGYRVIRKMYLSKGAPSLSANMLNQMRKEVYRGLSKQEKEILDGIILSDRMADIAGYKTNFNFPKYISSDGKIPDKTIAWRKIFKERYGLSDERAAELLRRAETYFEWMKKPLKDMLDAQLITKEEYDALVSHNYRRIKLVDIYDKRYRAKVGKHIRTVYDSGIEALAKGRETDIFEPSSEVMALEVFNRAYGRILNNRANLELLDLARRDPENPFVRVKEAKGDRIPTGWNRVFVFENGQRKALYLSPEMSKEWINYSSEISYKMGQVLRYASLSPVLRTFATGINWGFALANLPRDIMHTWYAARVFENGKWKPTYSAHAPVFSLQIGSDLAMVFRDSLLRKGRYEEYIKEGGGMEFLVHQGRLFQRGRHLEGPIDRIYDFMGYFGETSEIMTRLAIRERAIRRRAKQKGISVEEARKDPEITEEATFAARDYMDFGQGGGIAKVIDNGIPYLNAAIQGTRGMLRAFKDNLVVSTYKLAQFASAVVGLYIAMQKMHPKSFEALQGNTDMQNNLCVPLGDDFAFEDSRGQTRYPYLKLPLDPSQKFFKTFFEAATDKWLGNEVDVDRVVDSLKEQSPAGVTELPPSVSGVLGYITNKDFWLNEDIWKITEPLSRPHSKEEYIPGETPLAYIDLGAKTELSPERTKYLVEELTTEGTIWSYLLGEGYDKAFGDPPKGDKEKHLAEVLAEMPIIKRFFGITHPYTKFAKRLDEVEEKDVVNRWIQTRGLDLRAEGYLFDGTYSRKEVFDYISSFKDRDVYKRLKERFKFHEVTKDLPNRSFWLRVQGFSPEARAKAVVDELRDATPERKEQLRKELNIVRRAGGIVSDRFREEVMRLLDEER